jgi:hypothetical protein
MGNSSLKLVYLKRESFAFTTNFEIDCDLINDNLKRYKNILFPPNFIINVPDNENILIELRINIESNKMCPGYPGTNEDESCIFNINY